MSGKIIICALSCAAIVAFGTACGEQKPAAPVEQKKPAPAVEQKKQTVSGVVKETAKGADKVVDNAIGTVPLQQKKKIETKLQKIQNTSNQQLEKEMK